MSQDPSDEAQAATLLDADGNPSDPGAAGEHSEEEGNRRFAGILSWVVSGALHATALLLAGTIYFLTAEPVQEIPPVRGPSGSRCLARLVGGIGQDHDAPSRQPAIRSAQSTGSPSSTARCGTMARQRWPTTS